jgi:hypothetical protein
MIDHPRRKLGKPLKIVLLVAGAAVLLVVVLGIAFSTVGIPNVIGLRQEAKAVAMLRSHPTHDEMRDFLVAMHANWHPGRTFEDGEALGSFAIEGACKRDCNSNLQVDFNHRTWLCEITGDVITATFDRRGRLKFWKVTSAVDGC